MDVLGQFLKDRDEALLSLDEQKIRDYMDKYNIQIEWSGIPEVFWRAVHKSRTAAKSLPMEARSLSKKWLIEHGSKPLDDGDVPV